jgi:signal transduction histidine kinase
MLSSLRHQLLLVWMLMVVICCSLSVLLYELYGQTEGVKRAQFQQQVESACSRIAQRYQGASEAARSSGNASGLRDVVLQLVLADFNGIEGGIWSRQQGPVGYAYPTYQGSGIKSDLPAAERGNIEATALRALAEGRATLYMRSSNREVLFLAACPLDAGTSAWTMTRMPTVGASFYHSLLVGMTLLLVQVVISAVGAGWAFRHWDRKLSQVEDALAAADTSTIPTIVPTGSKELDRLGAAVTRYATRLAESRQAQARLTTELTRHERLVTLGRMVATVAHEIRNPIATMRLAAENALAEGRVDDSDHLQLFLTQVQRLEGVVESLLTMVQPIHLKTRAVAVGPWLQELIHTMGYRDIELRPLHDANVSWRLDPDQLGRAVENLLRNAIQHRTPDTTVYLDVSVSSGVMTIDVVNQGADIPPALSGQLFEPFVSGRVDGNGLGLALVREIAHAHHGVARYSHSDGMTHFTLELPWRAS